MLTNAGRARRLCVRFRRRRYESSSRGGRFSPPEVRYRFLARGRPQAHDIAKQEGRKSGGLKHTPPQNLSLSTVLKFCTGSNGLRVLLRALILFLWRVLIVLSAAALGGRLSRVLKKILKHNLLFLRRRGLGKLEWCGLFLANARWTTGLRASLRGRGFPNGIATAISTISTRI